ncbi:hypothetical protein Nepgr_001689 [Nepenthes gracilis]|uniref:Uncharacterized protein n=1 Tax=Nepenthes gracilis TaxID=150966 RepID=A0AAD3P2Y9_NEPGR|nr:hypothetical protein Nepgr_001689 [Nepenthes gracilis]
MPQIRLAVDALGVATICLVFLLVLLGLFCIIYTLYFWYQIRRSGFVQLGFFNGPWIIRIIFVLFGLWWGFGEIIRLSLLRQKGRIFDSLGLKWEGDACKYYILSNLGFAEPCLFLTMSFLLRASLQWRDTGILSPKWNMKTAGYIVLYCLPVFALDFMFVLVAPEFYKGKSRVLNLPRTFTSTTHLLNMAGQPATAVCTYPLLCTFLHGLFAAVLTCYLLFLGRQMVSSVINRGLQRRVCVLIFVVSVFLPSRVALLCFSVMAKSHSLFEEALAFSGFLVLLSCVVVGIFILVYLPVADSLALIRGLRTAAADYNGSGLVTAANLGSHNTSMPMWESISFRTTVKGEASSVGVLEEEMATLFPRLQP